MMLALAIGLVISLFQALTQIQEITSLSSPRSSSSSSPCSSLMPFMMGAIVTFGQSVMDRIVALG